MAQSGPARRIHGAAHPQHRAVELREPIRVLNGSLSLANAGEACQRLHAWCHPGRQQRGVQLSQQRVSSGEKRVAPQRHVPRERSRGRIEG